EVFDKIKAEIEGLNKAGIEAKDKETAKIQATLAEEIKQGAKEFAEPEIKQVNEALRLMEITYSGKNYLQA
ncbi:MAG: hypothetical protein QME64_10130, partial [bacterium]|nr:hypothetical protein [bacterium]